METGQTGKGTDLQKKKTNLICYITRGKRRKKRIQGGKRLRAKYFGVAKARRMWLSVLAAPKFRSLCSPTPPPPLPPKRIPWRGPSRSRWLSAPRSGASHRRDFQIWLAGASPRRSQTGTLDLRQGWGKRRLPDGDRMVVQGEAGWCGQQQLRARPGPWTSRAWGPICPTPIPTPTPEKACGLGT